MKLHTYKIVMVDIEPPIWRRFKVSSTMNFHQFHEVIQRIMGWQNYHMYSFTVGNTSIEYLDSESDFMNYGNMKLEHSVDLNLEDVFRKKGDEAIYTYDLGDNWEHEVVLEKVENVSSNKIEAICLDGARACPKEDCGSSSGYYDCVIAYYQNKKWQYYPGDKHFEDTDEQEEFNELIEWLEDWQPEYFDIEKINKELKKYTNKLNK